MPYTREVSNETRRKIASANKGKARSEETKQKISAAKKGVKPTEETKQKISAAISRLWAKVPPKADTDKDNSKPIGF